MKQLLLYVGVALATILSAAEVQWMHDLDAAGKRAAEEGKLLLVEYTGSDWCRYCALQRKQVIDTPEFAAWLQKHCVPVEIDVPHDASRVGGEKRKQWNQLLCEEYGIKSFPTLQIMTPELVVVGGYSGAQNHPSRAIAELEKAFAPAKALCQAQEKEGRDKIKALQKIYMQRAAGGHAVELPMLRLVAVADRENISGLVPLYQRKAQMQTVRRGLVSAASVDERMDCVELALNNAVPGNEEELRRLKGQVLREKALALTTHPRSVEDVEKAREYMLESVRYESSPEIQQQLRQYIETRYADPAALLRRSKETIAPSS